MLTSVVFSEAISNGILKTACAVQPLSKSVAAIPDDATAYAIILIDLTLFKSRLIKNVFLFLPKH